MTEAFLHYLWQQALIQLTDIKTTDGQNVIILDRGMLNQDAGPDFLNARIKLNNTIWAGHIEIHKKSSEWLAHKHQHDEKYNNVILHVVLEDDLAKNTLNLPTIEIQNRFDQKYWHAYQNLLNHPQTVLCSAHLQKVPSIIITQYKERILLERWQDKLEQLETIVPNISSDWKNMCYIMLAKAFGFKVNQDGMQALALHTPLSVLEKHKDNLSHLEAILIGQSGLIPTNFQDIYTKELEKNYHFFRRKYDLTPIKPIIWNYAKLRPNNFPLIRIAQFAHLLFQTQCNFELLITHQRPMLELLESLNIETSQYFQKHYKLSYPSLSTSSKKLGQMGLQHIIINAIVPLRYWYYQKYKKYNDHMYETTFNILTSLSKEINKKTKLWPLENNNAFDSQSIIQIINTRCEKRRCLDCSIGNYILKRLT